MKYGFEEKNHGFETKHGFARNKKDRCSLYNERFSRSMDLQKKWWVSIMLWKIIIKYGFEEKNHGFETKYRFARNKKDGCLLYNERFSQSMDLPKKGWVFVM